MKCYKLTRESGQTYGCTQWGEGITHETSGEGELCGPGWLHFYSDPLVAVLMDPVHANFGESARLWEAEAKGALKDDYGRKGGCTQLTTIKEIPLPQVTLEHRVKFAILCVQKVCQDDTWTTWANNWLSGKDRTAETATKVAMRAMARSAAAAAAAAAAWSAAARQRQRGRQRWSATWSATCAGVEVAACAAARAARTVHNLDLIAIAIEACQ